MDNNQDFCIDDIFTEENVVLPDLIVEDPIEDIKSYPDDVYNTYYHLWHNNGETRLCFFYDRRYNDEIMYILGHGYVAVYLDFITDAEEKDEERTATSYSFDFVTPNGLAMYIRYLQNSRGINNVDITNRIATYIQFKNLKTKLNVAEKQYYLLSLASLKNAKLSEEKTALYISVYDYSNLYEGDAVLPILMPLPGMMGIVYKGKPLPNPQIPAFPKGRLKLQVNNVGQGNWNEVITRKKTRLVYDIGTYKEKKSRDSYVDNLILTHQYTRKPILVLSHWDLDHYNILLYMTLKELKRFSQIIVTTTLPSLTPFRLLQTIVTKTKVQLSLVDNNSPLLTSPANYIDVNNQILKLFVCRMMMSSKKLNLNESGLLLDVDGRDTNFLMTGDATYEQASDAIKHSYAHINQDKNHSLVVPHHGGGKQPQYVVPTYCKLENAVISVDGIKKDKSGNVVRNIYKHPTDEVIYHFIKDHKCKLLRTDYANEDILL